MEKRTIGLMITALTALCCAIPGCCIFIFGAVTAAGVMPYETEFNNSINTGTIPTWVGYVLLALALLLIAIPFVSGIITLRLKPATVSPAAPAVRPAASTIDGTADAPAITPAVPVDVSEPDEPIPPPL